MPKRAFQEAEKSPALQYAAFFCEGNKQTPRDRMNDGMILYKQQTSFDVL